MAFLITGGSNGIGRSIAERLAQPETDVFITYLSNREAAEETAQSLENIGARPHILQVDFGVLADIRAMMQQISKTTDSLDVIVHAAAMAVNGQIIDIEGEALDQAVTTNGTSIVHIVREGLDLLEPGSNVIFVTSKGSERALKGYGALGGPKALAEHMVRYLASEVASRGIKVNSISPGPVDTEARRRMFPDSWKTRLAAQEEQNPSGRGVDFDDIGNVVELMCDPRFTMVQGQTITIDGGLTL